ncbi:MULTISPECIES: YozE family protein [unclassified Sphingobium]|uniref:YozE family protein n=1 Tax=unclassified Sphingobium TaxID=2611147 RepID=UPI0035A667F2
MKQIDASEFTTRRQPFGTWLLAQRKRDDDIGQLAKDAFRDPAFPIEGDFKAVSKRLNAVSAPPEMHAALEEAETDWLAL